MDWLTKLPIIALCALLFVGSVCRLDMLRARDHRSSFIHVYTLSAVYAAGMVFDITAGARDIAWHELAGIGALLTHLLATRGLWKHGAPAITLKERP